MRLDHVKVAVARKFGMHAVTGFARFAVADPIGQNDEKFRRIERLIRSKQLARKFGANKLPAGAGGAVHDQHRISHLPCASFPVSPAFDNEGAAPAMFRRIEI